MNEILYKKKLLEFSDIEIKNVLARKNVDLLTGKSGAVLFYLHKYKYYHIPLLKIHYQLIHHCL